MARFGKLKMNVSVISILKDVDSSFSNDCSLD
jgi:hypothetical protein